MVGALQKGVGKQDGEKLFHLVGRIKELLEAKERRLKAGTVTPVSKDKRVFQIAYDELLLTTREELLKNRGCEVKSAFGQPQRRPQPWQWPNFSVFYVVRQAAPRETRIHCCPKK